MAQEEFLVDRREIETPCGLLDGLPVADRLLDEPLHGAAEALVLGKQRSGWLGHLTFENTFKPRADRCGRFGVGDPLSRDLTGRAATNQLRDATY
jgi:hypothetical protein